MFRKVYHLSRASATLKIYALSLFLTLSWHLFAQEISTLDNLWPVKANQFLQGFKDVNSGTALDFFPFLKKGNVALYLGENGRYTSIEFETDEVPAGYPEEYATFVFQVSYARSKDDEEPSGFNVFIDDAEFLTVKSHKKGSLKNWQYENDDGINLAFVSTHESEAYGDLFGYMFLNVPAKDYLGRSISIRMEEVSSNSRDFFMAIQNPVEEALAILAEPAILRTENGSKQSIKIDLTYLGKPTMGQFFYAGNRIVQQDIYPGPNEIYLLIDPVKETITHDLVIDLEGRDPVSRQVSLNPVRPFEVYFLPHSHVDIGFTHEQDEVARLQWRNLDMAIDLAEKTAGYPEGSRYKWNAEISWVLDGYLEQASEERKAKFVKAVNDGIIGIDGLYGSVLTGLQREEELFKNTLHAQRLREAYGFDIQSAMITDVPGYTWGIVPALAQTGIKYFSVGPNHMPQLAHGGYQVGKTFEAWGDIPMYWVSPSGKEKILFWMSSHGYSWFHSWLMGNISHAGGSPILNFLDELERQKYPYDIVQLRYNIGNDNGPPDPDMPDFFKAWNEKYEWPKFRIATTMEMMNDFVDRYEDIIPEATGDFTPYWEDGASSSAEETAINRNTADRLVQAEALWAMIKPEKYPAETFDEAWKNVVLFSEHTWGANISKSDPDAAFTKSLWNVKKGFALDAQKTAEEMIDEALYDITTSQEVIENIQVINTLSWSRTNLVKIPASWNLKGDKVLNEDGKMIPSQRLNSGELAFIASDIPPFGSKVFTLKKGKDKPEGSVRVSTSGIENDLVIVAMNTESGGFASIKSRSSNREHIDANDTLGFNTYWYSGKIKENLSKNHSPVFSIKENGPLISTLLVESLGQGANKISQEIEMVSGFGEINITNTVDKIRIVEDENVRFTFPFDIPDGEVRIDIPWTILAPGKNQIKGANNNFYSVQRFLDISNKDYGITITSEDAPVWEIGDMYGQFWMSDMVNRPWLKDYVPSQRLISWVMNNLWFVNYKAHQEGEIVFRHTLRPHAAFNAADAKKLGMEKSMPLIITPSDRKIDPILKIDGSREIFVTSLKPGYDGISTLIRLFNSSDRENSISINWVSSSRNLYRSSPLEEKGPALDNEITLGPWEILTIRAE